MISTFKSLSKGTQRLIISLGVIVPIIATFSIAPNFYTFGEFLIGVIIFMALYSIVAMIGLWIYDGFDNNKKPKDDGKFQDKNDIVRYLLKKRVQQNPKLNMDENKINSLQDMELAGMPESTIVAIIELYTNLKKADISDNEIFQQFESIRPSSGKMPSPLTLDSYINYRLKLEHKDGLGLTEEFTSEAIKICSSHYNL